MFYRFNTLKLIINRILVVFWKVAQVDTWPMFPDLFQSPKSRVFMMDEITKEMFLNWNGENDTNSEYLTKLIVEILNNNNDDHINELKQAIIKENR